MNPRRDPETILAAWLDEGPTDLPDVTRRAILTSLPTTPQARRGLFAPGRTFPMNTSSRAGVAVGLAVLAVVFLGGLTLFRGGGVGGPGSTVPPSPTPCQIPMAIEGLLGSTPCRSFSDLFRPALSVGGDSRWQVVTENGRGLDIHVTLPGGQPENEGVSLVTIDRLAASPCQAAGQMIDTSTVPFRPTTSGSGPSDVFAWLAAKTPLKFPAAQAVTIAGHAGLQSTLDVPDGSPAACGGTVWFTWTADSPTVGGQWIAASGGLAWRLTAIDVQGTTVVITTYAPTDRFATVAAEADKLLASLRFE